MFMSCDSETSICFDFRNLSPDKKIIIYLTTFFTNVNRTVNYNNIESSQDSLTFPLMKILSFYLHSDNN